MDLLDFRFKGQFYLCKLMPIISVSLALTFHNGGDLGVDVLRPVGGQEVDGGRAEPIAAQRRIVLQPVAGAVLNTYKFLFLVGVKPLYIVGSVTFL